MVDLVLTEADAGRTIEVAPGGSIQLRLPENPTTGYRWIMTVTPTGCLEIGSDAFEREAGAAPGAGGLRVIGIKVSHAPECGLVLAYQRPWERDAPAMAELTWRFLTTHAD